MTERESELLERVLDGRATAAEEGEFSRRLKANPDFRASWMEQVSLHVLLQDNPGAVRAALGQAEADSARGASFGSRAMRLAASLAVFFGAAALLAFGVKRLASGTPAPAAPVAAAPIVPVTVQVITQQEERITMPSAAIISRAAAVTAAVATVAASVAAPPAAVATEYSEGGLSDAFTLNADPDATCFWRTAETNVLSLAWDWPAGAASATLSVTGAKVSRSYDFDLSVSNALVKLDYPAERKLENVYTLAMAFKDGSGNVLTDKSLAATLGMVRGVNGRDFRLVGNPADDAWPQAPTCNVLPVEAGVRELLIDKKVCETGLAGAAGWYLWADASVGLHEVAVVDASSVLLTASVKVVPGGTIYFFQ